jgi:four helix bundle protein
MEKKGFMKTHKDLDVWKLSVELAKDVFIITERFPKEVAFTLVSQITRSAISVPSNIAEGSGRASKKEFANFISIALGSLSELETQLYLARELKFPVDSAVFLKVERVGKMLVMLRRKLRQYP